MKKLILALLCVALTLGLASAAMADAVITRNGYTAYLGQENHLFLLDPAGVSHVLPTPIADLTGMNDTELFCRDMNGQLYGIMLDSSGSRIVAAQPTEADLTSVSVPAVFLLEGTTLSLLKADGTLETVSTTALAACSNGSTLFYIEQAGTATTLKARTLETTTALAGAIIAPTTRDIGPGVSTPLSMTATEDAVAIVDADHAITTVNLTDNSYHQFPATSQDTTLAVSVGNRLVRLHQSETFGYTVELTSDTQTVVTTPPVAPAAVTVTPVPQTQQPQATATPKVTAKPTAKPSTSDDDGRISKGARGSKVRKMQDRLNELGYPVGKVDGVFGDNTMIAVRLFYDAIGYKERAYASSAMLDKLHGKNAPVYDPYAPLKSGDRGQDVRILQQMLFDMGYLGKDAKEVDGAYGPKTVAAVTAFQTAQKIDPANGEATKDTLVKLYEVYELFKQGVTPTPGPTPTEVPTVTPPAQPDPSEEPDPGKDPGENPDPGKDPGESPDPGKDPGENPDPGKDPGENPDPGKDPGENPDPGKDPGDIATGTDQNP